MTRSEFTATYGLPCTAQTYDYLVDMIFRCYEQRDELQPESERVGELRIRAATGELTLSEYELLQSEINRRAMALTDVRNRISANLLYAKRIIKHLDLILHAPTVGNAAVDPITRNEVAA